MSDWPDFSAYLLLKRDVVEQLYPADTVGITRTSGVSGAWSAYGELVDALPNDFILCGAYVYSQLTITTEGSQVAMFSIRVARGAAGSEAPLFEGQGALGISPGGTAQTIQAISGLTIFCQPQLVPAGTCLAYAASTNVAVAVKVCIYVFGYNAAEWAAPISHLRDWSLFIKGLMSQTQGTKLYNQTVVSGSPTWTYGTPVEYIASAAAPLLILGAAVAPGTIGAGENAKFQVCLGGSGSEVGHSKFGAPAASSQLSPLAVCELARPLYVQAGERISVKAEAKGTTKNFLVGLRVYELK